MLHAELTSQIIEAFYRVNNTLGYGFLEKVYENALAVELRDMGLNVLQQLKIEVVYKNRRVGYYEADLVINDVVIVETKSKEFLKGEHEAQLINYLKASGVEVGLLLNFGRRAEFRRKIFSNTSKGDHKSA